MECSKNHQKFKMNNFDHLPPKARETAISLDQGTNRDVTKAVVCSSSCGCMTTHIHWVKDCHHFEDDRTTTVVDLCQRHAQASDHTDG